MYDIWELANMAPKLISGSTELVAKHSLINNFCKNILYFLFLYIIINLFINPN
jgi:hypothetical protein